MRALLLGEQKPAEEGPLALAELPIPEPGPGQILVLVLACGVCHTDLHIAEGDLPLRKSPVVLGHQVVGEVAALGPGVTRFQQGQRVGLFWLAWACGECPFCQRGQENLCSNAQFTGYTVNGGFAEYTLAFADFAFPLPKDVPPEEEAPLLCAGLVGFRALKLSGAQKGEVLGLYGFGASAHLVIQAAHFWGLRVFVFTRSPAHREQARELGAEWVGGPEERPPEPLHAAIVFAPAGWIVPQALASTRPGGTVVLAGIHMSPIPEMPYRLLWEERVVRSVANATRADGCAFLRLAQEARIRPEVQVFPWEKANEALLRLKRAEIKGAAVLKLRS
ncbi:MAG: zinc-dependent alcohol dehydrogenase family protein [Candidatus Bipolaricaulota bacterium]|nr:zinc-dependent alcohol dehydrogenase family protein [Candidatus Bipolaricaulota bacterium]MDW8126834.1 zinc-dependent alcohol dehydrogenase family protein [Candidatus Bipolaricaulota bacterium]